MKGKKQPNSILGITFDGHRLESTLVKKGRGGFHVQGSSGEDLTLDPLVDDPELVGREIKDRLHDSGVSEKRCAVGLPLEWTLTSLVKLPDLPEEHIDGFIRLQAEKSFPFSIDDLCVAVSKIGAGDDRHALITAIPRKHVELMESALVHAGLKPLSFSLGLVALQETRDHHGKPAITLFVNQDSVSVLVSAGDNLVSVRSFKDAWTGDEPNRQLNTQAIGRELRITLGQVPTSIREDLKKLAIVGASGLAATLANDISARATALGLTVETTEPFLPNGEPVSIPFSGAVAPALALAARYLDRNASALEYLPPKVSPWQKVAKKLASRKAGILAGTGIAVVAISVGAFLWQSHTLSNLRAEWKAMEPKVTELDEIQSKIREFRSWYDASQPTLNTLKGISMAFPENDSITAKTMEIRNGQTISISGSARDTRAVVDTANTLSENENIADVKIENMRGSPVQFSIVFRWQKGGAR